MSSKIEWTEETLNPIVGCTKVSAGCENCYALAMVVRLAHNPKLPAATREKYRSTIHKVNDKWEWSGVLAFFPERLGKPLTWRKPKMVFVCSMSDLFHEDVKDEWLEQIFEVIATCDAMQRGHVFQILTKRPDIMRERLGRLSRWTQPFRNLWIGTTVENQEQADKRIPELLQIPAAVRFVSVEPMLGAISFRWAKWHAMRDSNHLDGLRMLDWVICGGESGHGARPMHPDWARSLRDQCTAAGVPFFFKQWGKFSTVYDRDVEDPDWRRCSTVEHKTQNGQWLNLAGGQGFHGERVVRVNPVGKKKAGRELDGVTWDEMPEGVK